jgi:hypothetical protein
MMDKDTSIGLALEKLAEFLLDVMTRRTSPCDGSWSAEDICFEAQVHMVSTVRCILSVCTI